VTEVDRLIGALEKGKRYRESQIDYRAELEKWTKAIVEKATELEKDFKKAKKDREKEEKEAKEKSKEFKEKKYKEDKKPRRVKLDPDDEALARVVDGEVPLVVEVHRASEIRRLLDKTEPFDRLRLVVAGGAEALPFADELVERDIPVIVWPTPMGSARPDEYRENDLSMAGDLARAGVRVLIGSGGGSDARELRFLAALAVGHGMDPLRLSTRSRRSGARVRRRRTAWDARARPLGGRAGLRRRSPGHERSAALRDLARRVVVR
jgi:imidazolonepropionase-like amidohydrolase